MWKHLPSQMTIFIRSYPQYQNISPSQHLHMTRYYVIIVENGRSFAYVFSFFGYYLAPACIYQPWKHIVCIFIQYNITISVAAIQSDTAPNREFTEWFCWEPWMRLRWSSLLHIQPKWHVLMQQTRRNVIKMQIRATSCLSASSERSNSEPACRDFYCKR